MRVVCYELIAKSNIHVPPYFSDIDKIRSIEHVNGVECSCLYAGAYRGHCNCICICELGIPNPKSLK